MKPEPAPSPLTAIDLSLLHAAKTWGRNEPGALLARFPAERRSSLLWAWESGRGGDKATALDSLQREHSAQARPDLTRVHPSWLIRALKSERASVQRVVASSLPDDLAGAVRDGLGLSAQDLTSDRPAEPNAAKIALAIWSVFLVGDVPDRDDDPPVIPALTRFDVNMAVRLIHLTGLAKWALISESPAELAAQDQARLAPLRTLLKDLDPRFLRVAVQDIDAIDRLDKHATVRAGLTSFARMLQGAEPYRVRWAMQHLPYPTAKSLRVQMEAAGQKRPMLVRWETELLRAAWTLLHDEGRIFDAWEDRT